MTIKNNIHKIGTSILVIIVGLALFFLGSSRYQIAQGNPIPLTFSWGSATVVSGSMEPAIPVGSIVLIHEQDTYQIGDMIAYETDSGVAITHRIISIQENSVITQGDANKKPDPPFTDDKIIGKIEIVIPYIGALILFLKHPAMLIFLGILVAISILIPNPKIKTQKGGNEE